ncbi:MAG: SMR family transporter [Pseudonocardia sp.]|nr:SMR family transporter [Pseudonocardia sp.]
MPAAVLLGFAIVLEVAGTVSLRLSEGFTKLIPSIVVVLGYLGAIAMLAQVLKSGMSLGVAYGVWAAAGVALVAIIGAVFLGDGLTGIQIGGIVMVIGGVLALEMGAAHS